MAVAGAYCKGKEVESLGSLAVRKRLFATIPTTVVTSAMINETRFALFDTRSALRCLRVATSLAVQKCGYRNLFVEDGLQRRSGGTLRAPRLRSKKETSPYLLAAKLLRARKHV